MAFDRKKDERRYREHARQMALYPPGHCVICKTPLGQPHGPDCPNIGIGVRNDPETDYRTKNEGAPYDWEAEDA